MKKNKLILLSLVCIALVGCKEKDPLSDIFGSKINEEETLVDNIEDNYRNYYEIFVGSYADSNNDGVGDLNGITNKLEYIKELNYNGIWLTPINKSPTYHKYDVVDYYEIDEDFGTINDLKNLVEKAHALSINVIIDLVLNHSSNLNKNFVKSADVFDKYINGFSINDEDKKYLYYYCFYENKDDINALGKKLYKYPGKNFYYEGNFSSNMPEPNFDSLAYQEEIKKIANYYLSLGVDGFRLDAVKYYYLNNTTKNVRFLSEFNDYVKSINPKAYIVGECWDADVTIEKYYDSGIDSFFYFDASGSNGFISTSTNLDGLWLNSYVRGYKRMAEVSKKGISAPFLDNHDMIRFTKESDINLSKFSYGLLSMLSGTTFTYYGDEIGMIGSNTGGNPDQNVRTPMMWSENDNENTKPFSGTSALAYPYGNVEENINDSNSIYSYYKKSNYLRLKFSSIARGTTTEVLNDKENSTLLIKKTYKDETIYILFNFSALNNRKFNLAEYSLNEVVGQLVADKKAGYIGKVNDKEIILPPYSIAILN